MFLYIFKCISSCPPSGGRCWQSVQHQWCDCGQHGDRRCDNGRYGHGRSPAGHRHSSAPLGRFPPSFSTLYPPALAGRPGPRQAALLSLLWVQQSERKSSPGQLWPQVWKDFFIFNKSTPLCSNGVFFSSPSSVALEMDSEDEVSETKSPISSLSCDGRREDRMDSCHPSPDLAFPPDQSAVSACESGAKVKRRVSFSSNTSAGVGSPNSFYLPPLGRGWPRNEAAFVFLFFSQNQRASCSASPGEPRLRQQRRLVTGSCCSHIGI